MPWQERESVDLRRDFVAAYHRGQSSMTELCEQFLISRKTGYKWLARFEAAGHAGLVDRSRRPHHSPRATDAALVEALCRARRAHPTWSARKLLRVLRDAQPAAAWPHRSTGCDLLRRRQLVRERRGRDRRHAPTAPLPPIRRTNEVWTTDFKGQFRLGDRTYCYPLTLRDGFSRYVLRCDALTSTGYREVQRRFARAFAHFGLPERIRSDNGFPFAASGWTRLSRLSVWWIRLGILPERIMPGHPEQNGAHEQFHRVLKAETARPPAPNRWAQQQRFRRFCAEYNTVRPHEALGDERPASCYAPAPRPLPARVPPVEYPGHYEVRRVACTGIVSWRGRALFLSEVLEGQDVAFEEVDDGIWVLRFATVRLARFDERSQTLTATCGA